MIDELYDFVEQNRLLLLLIESLIDDYPGLGGGSVNDRKSALNGRLAAFLGSRAASGGLRPIADPQIAAYFLGESVARFAQHRKRDPTAAMIDDHQCVTPPSIARQTVRLAEVGRSPFHGEVPLDLGQQFSTPAARAHRTPWRSTGVLVEVWFSILTKSDALPRKTQAESNGRGQRFSTEGRRWATRGSSDGRQRSVVML